MPKTDTSTAAATTATTAAASTSVSATEADIVRRETAWFRKLLMRIRIANRV
jgi:hypothetical protein